MFHFGTASMAVAAAFSSVVVAQQSGWVTSQVNATMCQWQQLRASVIRDILYLDGGNLYWTRGMADGSYGTPILDFNPLGYVYTLNLSTPFNISQNFSALLGTSSKTGGSAANNIAPNYFDGAMLANDDEWFLYGGLISQTAAYSPPAENDVTGYAAYQYGAQKDNWAPGSFRQTLPDDTTRYIAYGGAANAPSENKAWYFSGLRSPSSGPIYYPSGINESILAVNVSSTLIQLDMSTQLGEKWTNMTLPDYIRGRANPELVWVPVGAQGILVALGGVLYPEFDNSGHESRNASGSEAESPAFMSQIDVYDIANDKWYSQPTSGGPSALTRGCAVSAPAQDGSSFNIYYYGGYDGLDQKDSGAFSDDVWILSLPTFMWMKIASGRPGYARAGHKCFMPYPDQMMVIGGYPAQPGVELSCLNSEGSKYGGVVQLFNLTTGKWLPSYDPSVYSDYGVPDMIFRMIGGGPTGGATSTVPAAPTGWATPALASVFATPYPTTKITTYYPYATAVANTSRPDYDSSDGGGGLPSFVPPLLGAVLGLILLITLVVVFLLYKRRKYIKKTPPNSDDETEENGNRILTWIRGQPNPADHKAPTVTTTEEVGQLSPDIERATPYVVPYEMADTQVVELMDTSMSPRAELHDTGLTPVDIINKHTHFAQTGAGSPLNPSNPSYYSSIAATDHASMVSSNSGALAPRPPPTGIYRPDSPSLPVTFAQDAAPDSFGIPPAARGSEISAFSDRERSHLRQISDPATVSTMDGAIAARIASPTIAEERTSFSSNPLNSHPSNGQTNTPPLVSPPTSGEVEGDDYLSAKRLDPIDTIVSPGSGSPQRRSVFHENKNDLGAEHAL